jgi:hypothetical protein
MLQPEGGRVAGQLPAFSLGGLALGFHHDAVADLRSRAHQEHGVGNKFFGRPGIEDRLVGEHALARLQGDPEDVTQEHYAKLGIFLEELDGGVVPRGRHDRNLSQL